jgi:GNAT superfamily N-acetyltransferase
MTETAILPFEARHARAFRDLNIAWVERHFGAEAKDYELLDDPEGRIIGKGGAILIAEDRTGAAIGCVALVPIGGDVLELAKMAVADHAQGQGIGRLLMDAAVAKARTLGARALYLESNGSLKPALHLYERTGFRHLPPGERPQSPYARCDVYMRLDL